MKNDNYNTTLKILWSLEITLIILLILFINIPYKEIDNKFNIREFPHTSVTICLALNNIDLIKMPYYCDVICEQNVSCSNKINSMINEGSNIYFKNNPKINITVFKLDSPIILKDDNHIKGGCSTNCTEEELLNRSSNKKCPVISGSVQEVNNNYAIIANASNLYIEGLCIRNIKEDLQK
jgi:hypothetical protein